MNDASCKLAFLDRDGTINADDGYVHRVHDWSFTDRAVEGIALLRDAGFRIGVVTNQSGIAAGLYSESDVDLLHAHVRRQLAAYGVQLDAIAVCPHARDVGCACRKPRTGMARQIERQVGEPIDYAASWTIGDKPSDVGFGLALGTRTALIRSRYWTDDDAQCQPTIVVNSLYEAAQLIVADRGQAV